MKLNFLSLILLFTTLVQAQVIPFGIMMNEKGNILYYGRETPGIFRHELYFKDDSHKRIISVDKVYLSWLDQSKEFYEESIRETYQYKYNKQGKIAEIKVIQKDQEPNKIKVYWNKPPNHSSYKTHVTIFSFN